ncbi:MAG: S49 family peptidase [Oligoflexales bacterium]
MKKNRLIAAVLNEPWAATSEEVQKVWTVVNGLGDPQSLRAKLDKPLEQTKYTKVREGVAIVSINGPLVRYAGVMSDISGATSYDAIARDLNKASEDPSIRTIVLEINSGGGTVTSCSELASHIQNVSKTNQDGTSIVAYVDGQCCSAAYWLASACSRIYASDTAIIGSIGVQMIANADDKVDGEITFLSSQSPNKNAPVSSKEGKAERQRIVDDLAEVFVGAVAQYRGLSKEEVLKNYGQGSVFVSSEALERGLIDEISTMENLLGEIMELNAGVVREKHPEAYQEIFEEGAASVNFKSIEAEAAHLEKERILGILGLKGSEKLTLELIKNASSVGDAAIAFRKDEIVNGRDALSLMQEADDELNAPSNNPQATSISDVDQAAKDIAEMKRIGVF